jgi:hypothetical protein
MEGLHSEFSFQPAFPIAEAAGGFKEKTAQKRLRIRRGVALNEESVIRNQLPVFPDFPHNG